MSEWIFWLSLSLLMYAFLGYPLILRMWAAFGSQAHEPGDVTPSVSILLSVFNEEPVIADKIRNFLAIDYPDELLELVVVSDGCTDRTEEIVASFASERIRLFVQERRGGKTLALNRGAAEARGDTLVFTDANSMFDPDAVRMLVRHFADPTVGLVSGKSVYLDSSQNSEEAGGAYRRYEDFIKEQESRIGSIVGADGAIYALRKSIYEPLRPEYINDLIHTFQAVLKGYRALNEPGAVCREVVDETHANELSRQTRIMAQSWIIVCSQSGRLLRAGKLSYLWMVVSHKPLRWLTLPLLGLLLAGNVAILAGHPLYMLFMVLQSIFFGFALAGRKREGVLKVPYLFLSLHLASVCGLVRYLRGNLYMTWTPRNQ